MNKQQTEYGNENRKIHRLLEQHLYHV